MLGFERFGRVSPEDSSVDLDSNNTPQTVNDRVPKTSVKAESFPDKIIEGTESVKTYYAELRQEMTLIEAAISRERSLKMVDLKTMRKLAVLLDEKKDALNRVEVGEATDIDETEILKSSREYYNDHGLLEFSYSIPEKLNAFSPDVKKKITDAVEQGFDRMIILPPVELQAKMRSNVIDEMCNMKVRGLKENEQYDGWESFDAPDMLQKVSKSRRHPQDEPYLLMYRSSGIPLNTKGKTFLQIRDMFDRNGWNGMTLEEHLLIQRRETEERGSHEFDASSVVPELSNFGFAIDSGDLGYVVTVNWNQNLGKEIIKCHGEGLFLDNLGANPTIIIPLADASATGEREQEQQAA